MIIKLKDETLDEAIKRNAERDKRAMELLEAIINPKDKK